jgi:hypothetical protein
MRSEVSKLVETCWQVEKQLKGLKRQKYFCGFADECSTVDNAIGRLVGNNSECQVVLDSM